MSFFNHTKLSLSFFKIYHLFLIFHCIRCRLAVFTYWDTPSTMKYCLQEQLFCCIIISKWVKCNIILHKVLQGGILALVSTGHTVGSRRDFPGPEGFWKVDFSYFVDTMNKTFYTLITETDMNKWEIHSMLAGLAFKWKLHHQYHIIKWLKPEKGIQINTSAHLYINYLVFQESPCADVQGHWQLRVLVWSFLQ